MKKIILGCLVVLLFATTGCDSNIWPDSDINKVPIYRVTNIQGDNAPYELQVYKNKPLFIQYTNKVLASNFKMLNYNDKSANDIYNIAFNINDSINVSYSYSDKDGNELKADTTLNVGKDYHIFSTLNSKKEVVDSVRIVEDWPEYTKLDGTKVSAEKKETKAPAEIESDKEYN